MFSIHRKPGRGRHRMPDPSEFADWGGPLRAEQPHVDVRPNPELAAAVTAPLPRIVEPLPLPIPSREQLARAEQVSRLGSPQHPFDGMAIRPHAAPQAAAHEGLAPVTPPHLPQVQFVNRTADTVTFAVTTTKPAPVLPAPAVAPAAPLPKRIRRHVPPEVLPQRRTLLPAAPAPRQLAVWDDAWMERTRRKLAAIEKKNTELHHLHARWEQYWTSTGHHVTNLQAATEMAEVAA